MRLTLALLTASLASGVSLAGPFTTGETREPPCQQVSAHTFLINGPTDAEMRDCVRSRFNTGTTELIVNSAGGNIEMAMDIADHIARPELTVRVREKCYSSCANYLIPLAANLVVEPSAAIVIHGGIDGHFIQSQHISERPRLVKEMIKLKPHLDRSQVENEFNQSVIKFMRLAARQKVFAQKHNIGLGWFLYSESGDKDFGRHLEVTAGSKPHLFGWRLLLVEELLARSCLPNVRVHSFQNHLEENFINNPARFNVFRKAEGRRSLLLACTKNSV